MTGGTAVIDIQSTALRNGDYAGEEQQEQQEQTVKRETRDEGYQRLGMG